MDCTAVAHGDVSEDEGAARVDRASAVLPGSSSLDAASAAPFSGGAGSADALRSRRPSESAAPFRLRRDGSDGAALSRGLAVRVVSVVVVVVFCWRAWID